ncbi:MAG: PorP/SprF family type IX secretion system membrane protein [Bacteroidales bacterium]
MKKHVCNISILLIFSVILNIKTYAQEIPIYFQSQYLFAPYLINPAIAGSKDFYAFTLSSRQNVEKIANAPRTQALTFQARIPNYRRLRGKIVKQGSEFTNVGLGAYIYHDTNGPLRKTGLQATYAYHVPLSRTSISHLSFGLSANIMLYSLFYGDLNTLRDPLIDEGTQSTFIPDANFGIYYYGRSLYAGISSNQLFENSIKWESDLYVNTPIKRQYFLLAGYKFYIKYSYILEPSIMVRSENPSLHDLFEKLDFNLKFHFRTAALGVSYRMNNGLVCMGQYQFQNWVFGLAYEYPFSSIWNYNGGMAEVMVGLNLGKGKNRFGDSRYW